MELNSCGCFDDRAKWVFIGLARDRGRIFIDVALNHKSNEQKMDARLRRMILNAE